MHADLSEYNILFHNGHLWIIDVSQSVEHDHPSAFDFLRNDIKNVEEFFGRLGAKCLGLRRCFEFITKGIVSDPGVSEEDALRSWLEVDLGEVAETGGTAENGIISAPGNLTISDSRSNSTDKGEKGAEDAAHEDSVFLRSFIPRNLNEVYDPERDVERLKRGDALIYADTIGLLGTGENAASQNGGFISIERNAPEFDEELEDADLETDDDIAGEDKMFIEKTPRGHRHEDKEAKKVTPA